MDTPFVKRYYRLPRAGIAPLRFLLESYDGLLFMRTLDPREALVEVAYPPSRRRDAEDLLAALCGELSMTETPPPPPERCPPL